MSAHRPKLSRRISRWLRKHGWTIGIVFAATVFAALVGGVFGLWGDAVEQESWLSAASTLLAAVVAAVVALYVLGRQRRDADERHRKTKEIEAAAEISAYIGSAWYIATSEEDVRAELRNFTLRPNALAELHRLAAVWGAYLDRLSMRKGLTDQGPLVRAISKFGHRIDADIRLFRELSPRDILGHEAIVSDLRLCHDALQEIARKVVMMPWWDEDDRAHELRQWLKLADSLPQQVQFIDVRPDWLPEVE